jgi:dihydrofolate reductase
MGHGLVDEYRLMVFPVVLGRGKRLFSETPGAMPLERADAQPAGECLILIYRPGRER